MKIELGNNTMMSAALDKVEQGEFFEALCCLARVDSYESILNQIACFCELKDIGYVAELYRRLLARYHLTHNCHVDLSKLSEQVVTVLGFFDDVFNDVEKLYDPKKISADENLLFDYDFDYGADFDDEYEFEQELPPEQPEQPSRNPSVFYEVNSPEHFDVVFGQLQRALSKGKRKETAAAIDQLLSFNSQDVSIVETQIYVCLIDRQFERAIPFIYKLQNSPDATFRGLGAAARALGELDGDDCRELLCKILSRLVEFGDDVADYDMMDYVQIAASKSGDKALTVKLTKILFSHYKDAGCYSLRLCARVFFNCGEMELAREAALLLLRVAPWDCFANVLLDCVNSGLVFTLSDSSFQLGLVRHLDVPSQLAVVAQERLARKLENGEPFTYKDYVYLNCVADVAQSWLLRGNTDQFANFSNEFCQFVSCIKPSNLDEFYAFAKQQLSVFLPESTLQASVLTRLIELGCHDKVLVSLVRGYYTLNLANLTLGCDPAFIQALAICATVRKVDARRLERSYLRLLEALQQKPDTDRATARKVAFYLLATCYKDFLESEQRDNFTDDETSLYLQIINGPFV